VVEPGSGSRTGRRLWWLAALVVVPVALAGLALLRPGPQLADDLRERSERALDRAGLPDVVVTVTGRDAELHSVPPGAETSALRAVGAVTGIREVHVDAPGPDVLPVEPVPQVDPPHGGAPAGPVPTAAPPITPDEGDTLPVDARQRLVEQIATAVAGGPVVFAADSSELVGPAAATVQRVAGLLVAEPAARVELVGHVADTPGSVDVAQRLSERRAVVVADALVAGGVDRDRISTRGRGAEQPLATPAASRRVEISIP
jgi:outer membrane protein OmpA-like peptidoglycan-associated protein